MALCCRTRYVPGFCSHQFQLYAKLKLRQVLARTTARSIPISRQAVARPTAASARQFGTGFRSHARPLPRATCVGLLPASRLGAAGILSSQTIFFPSTRRFASTGSTDPPPSAAPTPSDGFSPEFSAFTDLDGPSLFNIPEQVGYLSNLGLDYGWGFTTTCEWVLEQLHFNAGLPWWAAIAGTAVAIRVAMVYPALIAQQESVKSRAMREDPLYKETQQKFMVTMAMGGQVPPQEIMEMRMQMKLLQEKAGVKTWKMFLPMLQFPFVLGSVKLFRAMAALPVPGLDNGGMLWFSDLTIPDPLFILPGVGTVILILSLRVCLPAPSASKYPSTATSSPQTIRANHLIPQRALPFMSEDQAKMMQFLPWVLCPLGFLVTMNLAASVQLFLGATAILQYIQTVVWHIPIVRSACGLPPLEDTIENAKFKKPRTSPFSNMNQQGTPNGVHYEPPRTISTTASEVGQETKKSSTNPLDYFKNITKSMQAAKSGAGGYIDKYKVKTAARNEKQTAADYEKRRVREENEKYWARREDKEFKRQQKKDQHRK